MTTRTPARNTRDAARWAVYNALRAGQLTRGTCADCGGADTEAHHHAGYEGEAALDIQWLCRTHHLARHPDAGPRSGGFLWGARRLSAKISLNQLAARSGISKGLISLMEHGRLIPTRAEYDAIVAALAELEAPTAEAVA